MDATCRDQKEGAGEGHPAGGLAVAAGALLRCDICHICPAFHLRDCPQLPSRPSTEPRWLSCRRAARPAPVLRAATRGHAMSRHYDSRITKDRKVVSASDLYLADIEI